MEIGKIKNNIYKDGAPIILEQGTLNQIEDKIFATLIFRSISTVPVSSILVDIHVFDRANIEIEVVRDFLFILEGEVRDSVFGQNVEIEILNENAKSYAVALRRVCFTNETLWTGSNSILFETLPVQKTLEEELEESETIEQFRRDFKENFSDKEEITAKYVPSEHQSLWFCSCGEINTKDDETCYMCGAAFLPQKTHIDNRVQLATNLENYKIAVAEEEKRLKEEALKKAEEERLAKAEKERLEAEAIALEEARIKRKRKIKITTISVSIPLVLIAITYIYLLNVFIIPQNKYNDAVELFEAGEYDNAISAFEALNGYSESSRLILEANFQKAQGLMGTDEYDEALEIFYSIESMMDVENDILEAKYQLALIEYNSENYEEVIDLFLELDGYSDTKDFLQSSYYELTKAYTLEFDLNSAVTYFEKLNEENTLLIQALFLENGRTLYNQGESEEAEIYFAFITDSDLIEQVKQVYYDFAVALIEEGLYDGAIAVFNEVLTYSDSADCITKCEYLKAEKLFENEEYELAVAQYQLVIDYENSVDRINECYYILAAISLENDDTDTAIEFYALLGDYEDSYDIYVELVYEKGVNLFKDGEYLESYETLYQIKEDSDAYYYLVSKSEFYIYVYEKDLGVNPKDEN
ncbi:MAG: hypothetical protein R3Y35_06610 [Clostridia bacterium]